MLRKDGLKKSFKFTMTKELNVIGEILLRFVLVVDRWVPFSFDFLPVDLKGVDWRALRKPFLNDAVWRKYLKLEGQC